MGSDRQRPATPICQVRWRQSPGCPSAPLRSSSPPTPLRWRSYPIGVCGCIGFTCQVLPPRVAAAVRAAAGDCCRQRQRAGCAAARAPICACPFLAGLGADGLSNAGRTQHLLAPRLASPPPPAGVAHLGKVSLVRQAWRQSGMVSRTPPWCCSWVLYRVETPGERAAEWCWPGPPWPKTVRPPMPAKSPRYHGRANAAPHPTIDCRRSGRNRGHRAGDEPGNRLGAGRSAGSWAGRNAEQSDRRVSVSLGRHSRQRHSRDRSQERPQAGAPAWSVQATTTPGFEPWATAMPANHRLRSSARVTARLRIQPPNRLKAGHKVSVPASTAQPNRPPRLSFQSLRQPAEVLAQQ